LASLNYADPVGSLEMATTIAAWGAIVVSVATAAMVLRQNARLASATIAQAQAARQSEAIAHFTSRYFDLVRNGEHFDDVEWSTQYWGLQSIEFFFFDQGWLPDFIYEIWMVELTQLGRHSGTDVWASRGRRSLNLYATSYPRMADFFLGLQRLSEESFPSEQERHEAVIKYVRSFPKIASSP
jgi:hypothetical protein